MKVKVKYSSTQKFIIQVEDHTLGSLKNGIRNFIETSYNQPVREPLTVSLNGSDPLLGSDDTTLATLGIVPGDMLTIITPSAGVIQEKPQTPMSSSQAKPATPLSASSASTFSTSSEMAASASTVQKPETSRMAEPNAAATTTTTTAEDDRGMEKINLLEVKDGHPSPALEKLFNKCCPGSASQAVNLIIHLTMLECGFHLESSLEIPPGWKEMVATFQYCHSSFPEFRCTLVLVTMGEVKQALASFPQQESEISVKVKVGEYVKDPSKSPIQATNLIRVAQLVRTLRDHLLHPLQVAAHQALGIPAPWHLVGLPDEMLLMIASSLEARHVLNLGQTCRRLHSAMEDNKLWHNLYKRDFRSLYDGVNLENYNLVDWKARYKEAAARQREWKRLYEQDVEFVVPGMLPPPHPFGPQYPFGDFNPPRGPDPFYPPQPHPNPNPFYDPDSPYFGGEMPPIPNIFPNAGDPFNPFGVGPRRPRPRSPFNPPFMPTRPRNPRGPRFDFF